MLEPVNIPAHRIEEPDPHGLLVVDKPPGPTSYDVIRFLRRTCSLDRKCKIGHLGTLDPFASGVMLIAFGQAVKYSEYALGLVKKYRARLWLGEETDTLDPTGRIIAASPVPLDWQERLCKAASTFIGEIEQVPPDYSAKQVDGKRAYKEARRGEFLNLKPVKVHIYSLEFVDSGDSWIDFICTVSAGNYVRAIGRDLAREIGTVGHLAGLERLAVGPFDNDVSIPFEAFEMGGNHVLAHHLRPVNGIVDYLPTLIVKPGLEADDKIIHGKVMSRDDFNNASDVLCGLDENSTLVITDPDGKFRAMGRYRGGQGGVTPFKPWVANQPGHGESDD